MWSVVKSWNHWGLRHCREQTSREPVSMALCIINTDIWLLVKTLINLHNYNITEDQNRLWKSFTTTCAETSLPCTFCLRELLLTFSFLINYCQEITPKMSNKKQSSISIPLLSSHSPHQGPFFILIRLSFREASLALTSPPMLPFASTDKQEPLCLIHETSKSLLRCQTPLLL